MTTTTMNSALRAKLGTLVVGLTDQQINTRLTWGRKVHGDMHGMRLELNGETRYYSGPFWSTQADGQACITRFG